MNKELRITRILRLLLEASGMQIQATSILRRLDDERCEICAPWVKGARSSG